MQPATARRHFSITEVNMTFDDAMDAVRRAHEDALLTAENQALETIRSRAEAFEKALNKEV